MLKLTIHLWVITVFVTNAFNDLRWVGKRLIHLYVIEKAHLFSGEAIFVMIKNLSCIMLAIYKNFQSFSSIFWSLPIDYVLACWISFPYFVNFFEGNFSIVRDFWDQINPFFLFVRINVIRSFSCSIFIVYSFLKIKFHFICLLFTCPYFVSFFGGKSFLARYFWSRIKFSF